MEKPACAGFSITDACTYKPNSVPAISRTPESAGDSHLSRIAVTGNLKRHFQPYFCKTKLELDTTLHGSKDLAVSPSDYPEAHLRRLSASEMLPAFRRKRLCSHLADCSVWELPTTLLPALLLQSRIRVGPCSDFPPSPNFVQ